MRPFSVRGLWEKREGKREGWDPVLLFLFPSLPSQRKESRFCSKSRNLEFKTEVNSGLNGTMRVCVCVSISSCGVAFFFFFLDSRSSTLLEMEIKRNGSHSYVVEQDACESDVGKALV